MMRYKLLSLILLIGNFCFSQQLKTLDIERENVDSNNKVFKTGVAAIYDYEIIENGENFKLNFNGSLPKNSFELVKNKQDTLGLKIHLLVPSIEKSERTNKNQTEIYYLFSPTFSSISRTGIIENENNTWMHPPRSGFFQALETCPFPYVKLPIVIGNEWNDKMKIGDHWCNEKWGVWNKKLLLSYDYKITHEVVIMTCVGEINCYVVESTADSEIGQSKLKSFYSEKYGFVRLEYEMCTGLKVNLWLESFIEGNNFDEMQNVMNYIKKQKTH